MLLDAVDAALSRLALSEGGVLHVIINDPDRATPTGLVLDALYARHPDLALHLTVACGTHRHPPEIRAAHVRAHGLERAHSVRWSDPSTPTPFPPSAPVLGIGSVEPHWFAGWTGAHKTLTVGVWRRSRIEANHAHALSPRAAPCVTDGNPIFDGLYDELLAWIEGRPGGVSAINLVADAAGLHAASGGPPRASLEAVLGVARARYTHTVERPLDRLIARVEPPLDRSLYQASKGIKNSSAAVRDGGAIVLVASCPAGVGIDHFLRALERCPSHADTVARVERAGYRLGDHKAVRLRHLTDVRGLHLGVVSAGLAEADARVCGLHPFATEAEARAWAQEVAPGPSALVLDDAGQRVVLVQPHSG